MCVVDSCGGQFSRGVELSLFACGWWGSLTDVRYCVGVRVPPCSSCPPHTLSHHINTNTLHTHSQPPNPNAHGHAPRVIWADTSNTTKHKTHDEAPAGVTDQLRQHMQQ